MRDIIRTQMMLRHILRRHGLNSSEASCVIGCLKQKFPVLDEEFWQRPFNSLEIKNARVFVRELGLTALEWMDQNRNEHPARENIAFNLLTPPSRRRGNHAGIHARLN